MSDYIKREDALKAVNGIHEDDLPRNNKIEVCDVLTLVPSADVAQVVRCKDCKHWDEHSQYGYDSENGIYGNYCMLWTPEDDFYAVETPADGFCFEAERRDDE